MEPCKGGHKHYAAASMCRKCTRTVIRKETLEEVWDKWMEISGGKTYARYLDFFDWLFDLQVKDKDGEKE